MDTNANIKKALIRVRTADIVKYEFEKDDKIGAYLVVIKLTNGDKVEFFLSEYSDVEHFMGLVVWESTLYIVRWKIENSYVGMADVTSNYKYVGKHFV